MTAYYNEFDPKAAAWLRELIRDGLIAPGHVDERSITDVQPSDLDGFTQVHLFAGIGGWSLALRLAGWPDDRPVWTGSCPCQPFSSAGKQKGHADTRHLWPEMFRLIRECRPAVVFGEQVPAAIRHGWLDEVFADLEGLDYACGATVLGSHSVGAPHIRQRLWWLADAQCRSTERRGFDVGGAEGRTQGEARERQRLRDDAGASGADGRLAHAQLLHAGSGTGQERASEGWRDRPAIDGAVGGLAHPSRGGLGIDGGAPGRAGHDDQRGEAGGLGDTLHGGRQEHAERDGESLEHPADGDSRGANTHGSDARPHPCRMGEPILQGPQGHAGHVDHGHQPGRLDALAGGPVAPAGGPSGAGPWSRFDLIPCRDGKARRIEPGLAPLAHGVPARVVRLRGYGNAINPHQAAAFVTACMDSIGATP